MMSIYGPETVLKFLGDENWVSISALTSNIYKGSKLMCNYQNSHMYHLYFSHINDLVFRTQERYDFSRAADSV